MHYVKPYTYFVSKPNGTTNLLWGSLALGSTLVIPFVGQIVLLGYQAEMAEDLEHDPAIEEYRDFNPNKFGEYLSRGVWPFLMQMLVGLGIAAGIVFAVVCGIAAGAATKEPLIGLAVGGVLTIPFTLIGTMVTWPMTLHAQLRRGFDFGGAVRFASAFLGKLGGQLFVALLVHMLISVPLTVAGLLLCVVGLYPALTIQLMAQEHYMMQLYRVYLDEGGEPVGGERDELEADER